MLRPQLIKKMEIKQTCMSAIIKKLVIAILLITSYTLRAQNPVVLGEKFEVKAELARKDSILVISYKNTLPFSQLIWANDFSIAALFNQSDISGSYLASPITNEIYLVNKTLNIRKTSNSFYLRNDSSELNLYNYKMLNPNEALAIKIKINNDSLYKQIIKKQFTIRGTFSFIDFTNVELWASSNQGNGKKIQSTLDDYTQKANASNSVKAIDLKEINWRFNRKIDVMKVHGQPLGVVEKGGLSIKNLVHPLEMSSKKLILFSIDEIYRFSNKQIFNIEIELR